MITKEKQQGKSIKRMIDASVDIRMNYETPEQEKAFLTRQLVQATLPHSNPGDVPVWGRTNGNMSLVIRPGWDNKKKQTVGYPYGTIPRLLLFWLTTEALRTGSRRIELGNSLSAFMSEIGLNSSTGGGKRGDAKRLRNQMERLFRSTFSFESIQDVGSSRGKRWLDMQIAPDGELWWDLRDPNQTTLFGSWVELGEKFYQAIISSPVPLDMRALKALKGSSLALDIYAWATYKAFSLLQNNKEDQFIPWKIFMQQLGVDYSDVKNFKKKCRDAFLKVQAVYPSLTVEYSDGGFSIKSGLPSVTQKKSKRKCETVDKSCG
jgi:hypothetical protein